MSGEGEEKCFTIIWKLENASYCWQKGSEYLVSPVFEVDELENTKWILKLYGMFGDYEDCIGFWLNRDDDSEGVDRVQVDCELAFLASDGTVLVSYKEKEKTIKKTGYCGNFSFITRKKVFFERRSLFLPRNTLTTCCRIWKSAREFSKEVQCYARTRVVVEKISHLWNIENFSTLVSNVKKSYEIKSQDTGELLICLELSLTRKKFLDEEIHISITTNYKIIKTSILKLFVVDASDNLIKCFMDEFCDGDPLKKERILCLTKKKLLEKKTLYLPNDVLSLRCDFSFSSGIVQQEIGDIMSDCTTDEINEPDDFCLLKEVEDLIVPKCTLINCLKSMVNNSSLSDVKLKTKSQTFSAHTFILGARSPVFKSMFSNDMKEKITGCVDIQDLNDDTVLRLLRYIYCADVELDWDTATQLYEAADKYEILDLKNICSSYLRNNLRPSNACEALMLSDLHQDDNLKGIVQDFILKHGKEVLNSEGWEQLVETNLKLVYETTLLKFKE